jgi:hypothetical protein
MNIGFSTGSLALGDFQSAIKMLENSSANVIELSALRESEFDDLLNCAAHLNLKQFKYISFHAPSKLVAYSEDGVVKKLKKIIDYGWPIVVHPDVIKDFKLWRALGPFLCIENMDKRKPIGRTTSDLESIFERLPEASFCFDLAHVRQVDPTMTEAKIMLKKIGQRLQQLHVSDVNSRSIHEPLNLEAIFAFRKISHMINSNIPIILESTIQKEKIEFEMQFASLIFDDAKFVHFIDAFKSYVKTNAGEFQKSKAHITA